MILLVRPNLGDRNACPVADSRPVRRRRRAIVDATLNPSRRGSTNGTMARVLSRPMADNVGDMLDSDLRATLVDVERLGWDSLCDSTGADFYGKIMTEDAVMVLANGAVMDRSAVVDALRQAPPWRRYDISDARLIEAGLDSVVLVYVGSAYRDGDDLISSVRCRASTSGEATNGASSPGPYVG